MYQFNDLLLPNLKTLFGYEIDYDASFDSKNSNYISCIRECFVHDVKITFNITWYHHASIRYFDEQFFTKHMYTITKYDRYDNVLKNGVILKLNLSCNENRQLIYNKQLNIDYQHIPVNQQLYIELLKTILQRNPFEKIIKQDMSVMKKKYVLQYGL